MKKIYVYVGQLCDWVLRMAGRMKEGFSSSMKNNGATHLEERCGKADDEIFRSAQDDKSWVATGVEVNDVRISMVERPHSNDDGKSLNTHPSSFNSNGETLLVRAERYLWERYEFRYNVLARGYEMASSSSPKGENFRVLDDEQRRYLMMQLQHAGINVPYISHIQAIVDCGRAQRYNPVVDYLTHLPEWDGHDHIDDLMRRVTSDEFTLQLLKRWMVAVVAQALGRMGRYGNCLCPLIISERQGWGKSQFTKLLLPPELMVHYTDTFNLTQEEQCLRKMGQHWLINLDEFDRHSATSHATLKGLLQLAEIKVKRPHRAQFEEMPRLASFIGTSNRRMLLRDRTGSRRYICVELSAPIDVDTPVCHEQLYAQALHLLDGGMRYWLDEEETLRLEEHNAPYKMEHGPEELLLQHFAPVEKKKHYEDDELWSAVAVYDYLHRIDALLMKSVERTTFGMYIRRAGFEQVRRENKRFYAMRNSEF
ncbi:MAG: hypothetical protein IKV15_07190 [Bacteroidaceae bacterium]|nr:hypothetical protein [Bacteroidaceae bacterium]